YAMWPAKYRRASTGSGIPELKPKIVQSDYCHDNAQPQSKTGRLQIVPATVEAIEHSRPFVLLDPSAAVDNVDLRPSNSMRKPRLDPAASQGEFDRVVQQIDDRLEQKLAIAMNGFDLLRRHGQVDRFAFGKRLDKIDRLLQDFLQPNRLETGASLLVFNLRDAQQRTETQQQRIHFGNHRLHHGVLGRRIAQLLLHPVKHGAQPGQRRAQIMRDIVADALGLRHQPFDFIEHPVHDGGQHVELVTVPAERQPQPDVSAHDEFADLLNLLDAAQRAKAQ